MKKRPTSRLCHFNDRFRECLSMLEFGENPLPASRDTMQLTYADGTLFIDYVYGTSYTASRKNQFVHRNAKS